MIMINELIKRYPMLDACREDIEKTLEAIISCYERGGKLLLCGNGGSAADCDHIVGELMKGFLKKRPLSDEKKAEMTTLSPSLDTELLARLQSGLPAVSLPSLSILNSAFCNDVDPSLIYAQSVLGLGKKGDLLIAISTSGNAENVAAAVKVARGIGMTTVGLTGESGGKLRALADICICAPEKETFKIQELHLPIYHLLCAAVENHFFAE
ncbi:MAG: SIS domain-containing protein [Clostridia bacterium]|nr:SIS domain-containing protein [Clostridia bacterium]